MKSNSGITYTELDHRHYLQSFKRFPVVIEKASGSRVVDTEGKEYIDALAGIAVNSTGHCHPAVVRAVSEQAALLMHISNFFLSKPQALLSEKLSLLSGLERVFLTNSGAESVEGAIKIARKYAHSQGKGGTVISFEGSFHGRTLATIAAGKKQMQEGFEPIPAGFIRVPFQDIHAVAETAGQETAAIIIEPVQGEGGIHVAETSFLRELRALCDERNIVLIFDEIQCGMGRTGRMFAWQHSGVRPDIMTLAKALGGGFPVGAILSDEKVSSAMVPGDHGTTFGGNPLACAAALAAIGVIEEEHLALQAEEKGRWLRARLREAGLQGVSEIRGPGLMIGIEFTFETKPLVARMLENGVIANATAGNVLRLVPPLTISYDDLGTVVDVLRKSLNEIRPHE